MSQIRQQSGQIYSSLIKLNPFVCRRNCLSIADGGPYCTTALHMAFQFKSRYSNLNEGICALRNCGLLVR